MNSDLATIVRQARQLTEQNFSVQAENGGDKQGPRRRMLLYAPLYLSSYCVNYCLYCGYRYPHRLQREHLTLDEALAQATILRQRGMKHLLLVAGDFPKLTSTSYFVEIIQALTEHGHQIAVELAPQTTHSYAEMARAGACGVTLYQETYNEELYYPLSSPRDQGLV